MLLAVLSDEKPRIDYRLIHGYGSLANDDRHRVDQLFIGGCDYELDGNHAADCQQPPAGGKTMNYDKLKRYFLFGGPVQHHNHRCHVVAMNDLLKTVTLECNGERIPDIKPEEAKHYDETGRSD